MMYLGMGKFMGDGLDLGRTRGAREWDEDCGVLGWRRTKVVDEVGFVGYYCVLGKGIYLTGTGRSNGKGQIVTWSVTTPLLPCDEMGGLATSLSMGWFT